MTPEPDRPAPDPASLAGARTVDVDGLIRRARDQAKRARGINPYLLDDVADALGGLAFRAEAAEREAVNAILAAIGLRPEDGPDILTIEEAIAKWRPPGLPPDGRPAGDAGGERVGDDGDFPARVRRQRAAMEAEAEGVAWDNLIHMANDLNERPLPVFAARDDSGETMLDGLARLAARCEIAARAVAAGLPDPPTPGETFDRLRELSKGGDWSDLIDEDDDDEDEAPSLAALRAQAEDYRAKWEDALARLDAVTGTLALYGRRAEAGRELARAWLEWCRRIESGDPATFFDGTSDCLREQALRVLARPIGGRDGDGTPEKAPEGHATAPGTPPAVGMDSGASAADGGQGGALRASDEAESGDWPEDSGHENGDYENRCVQCGRTFTGHKRRVVCRVCAKPDESPVDPDESGPSDRTTGLPGALAGPSRRPVPGWRFFVCPECGRAFQEPTRDCHSPSVETCPECQMDVRPSGLDPHPEWPTDRGNLPPGFTPPESEPESEPGPASPRPCPFCGSEDAEPIVEGPDDLPRHRVRCPDCWARGPADFDDVEAIGYWNAAWDRRAGAAPGDAPAARAIDAGAVERAAERIVRLLKLDLFEDSVVTDDRKAMVARLLDAEGHRPDWRVEQRITLETVADILRESLGLAPSAGDAPEKGQAPS
jgi:hypothetical protein